VHSFLGSSSPKTIVTVGKRCVHFIGIVVVGSRPVGEVMGRASLQCHGP
jgi:hypothetical protein